MDFLSADSLPWLQDSQQRLRTAYGAGRLPHSLMLLSNPGLGAQSFDVDGSAKFVPKGSDIVFNIHYTAAGTAATAQTEWIRPITSITAMNATA